MSHYNNNNLSINDRVDDLIARMRLEEKVLQMVYDAPAIERLEIPTYNWWNEGLHGVGRAGMATVFPQAIGLAATWDEALMLQIATAVSDEARAKHHEFLRRGIREIYTGLTYWSPNINIFRDPRWGRGQETYGEDPYLTASLGVQFIKGLQGDDPQYLKLIATPKHFAAHSGPELERHRFNTLVSDRDMHETYLPHFEAGIKEGNARSIMGAYNRINGEACCASPTLLQKVLRDEWKFEGFVVSDCWAIIDIYLHHRIVETPEEAAALAVNNGCELNCGSTYPYLLGAIEQGLISEETIDRALKLLFKARFELGMFDAPDQVPYAQIPYDIVNSEGHQALALQAARESIVLLKNENNVLPLAKDTASIAVIGPNADELQPLLGNYHGTPAKYTTPLAGIREKVSQQTEVMVALGCGLAEGWPPLDVIPTEFLRPDEDKTGETGLTALYFNNPDFAGVPEIEGIDPTVDARWIDTTPFGGKGGDKFSIRWTGFLVPPTSGTFRLGGNGFSAYNLYLDDDLVITYDNVHHPRIITRDLDLQAGRFYKVRLEFISKGLDPQMQLLWAVPGFDYEAEALETAEKADVIIAVMGLSPNLEGEEMPVEIPGFSGGDRTDISLPDPQEALLKQLHKLGKPLILVLLNGSALAINWAAEYIPAIVEAWYPGQAGGDALADVLFGDYNPAGRLPVTFYRSVDDLPPFEEYKMVGRTYRYFQGEPLFPFGYGLSYSTFLFENLSVDQEKATAGGQVNISAVITNTSDRAGDEVVQLYTRQFAAPPQPLKELKGYKRITLQPGESKSVTFTLYVNQLGVYDEEMTSAVHPGRVEVMVGNSSTNLPLAGSFEIVSPPSDVSNSKVFFSQVQVQKV
jgi:beta-glucosidase